MRAVSIVVIATLSAVLSGCGADDSKPSGGVNTAVATAIEAGPGEQGAGGAEVVTAARAEEIYNNFCFSCHAAGLSGAPKLGDVEAWAPRIAKGSDLLLQSTIVGMPPAMPARGICFDCSDAELAATVEFMVARSQ